MKNKLKNVKEILNFINKKEDYKDEIFDISIALNTLQNSDLVDITSIGFFDIDVRDDIQLILNELKTDKLNTDEKETCETKQSITSKDKTSEYEKVFNDNIIDEFIVRTSTTLLEDIDKHKDIENRLAKLEKDNETLLIAVKFLLGND